MSGTVVVTGASGYIGQHLVRRLAEDGWKVTALLRRPPSGPVPPSVTVALGDVTDYPTLPPRFVGADAVVHLACLPIQPSSTDPRHAFAVNALGSFNVVEACRENDVGRVVVTSTAYVYGDPVTTPISEDHPTVPTNPYGASKLAGDAFAIAYGRSYGISTVLLRIFNVFGASADGRPRRTVETLFAERARAGLPVTINGHPGDARDFVHVADVVDALAAALCRNVTGIYNIGSGTAHSLSDVARAARIPDELLQRAVDQTDRPPLVVCADISRARRDLDFEPRTNILDFVTSLVSSRD